MVHFNILRKVRRKQKSKNASSRNHSAASSSNNNGSSYFESSEEEEEEDSYLSSDASFYSSSSGSSDYDDDYEDGCSSDDVSCESGLSQSNESDTGTTLPYNMPNFVRAIAQYASLDICNMNHQNTNTKTSEDKHDKAPGKIKKESPRSSSGGGGLKSFQQSVGGKFECIFKSMDTRKKASDVETSHTVNVVETDLEVHQVEKDNVSLFTEKFQKQFQDWADRAKKFESMHLLNAYNAQNEEDLNDTVAAASPSVASQDIIESRNEVDEVFLNEPDERDEPALSPRKARSLRLANRKTYSFRTRGRTKSEGHKESFQKMAIMSPRLTTNIIRPILSPKQQQPSILSSKKPKKNVFSPKNCKVPCIRKRKDKATSRRREDDIDIDELVAHVIGKRSAEASYEQDENLFMHHQTLPTDTDSAENRQQSDDFPDRQPHPEPEVTAKQLELAQKEIEYLKRLLQEKGRVSDRDDTEKMTNNQASFNFSEMQSFESGLTTNQNNKDTSGKGSSESLMDRLYSHEEIFSQEDLFPFAENDFEPNSKSQICDNTSKQDEYGDNDLFWDDILVSAWSGYEDHDDEVSLLSNTFSPRRYVKPKRISLRKS